MVYKVKKETVRKYYKVSTTTQTWTQPSMSANGSLGGDIFAVSSTNDSNNAYHAFDSNGVSINLGTLTLYNPNPFCITKLVFEGRSYSGWAQAYVKAFTLYGSNDNSSWIEIQSFSGGTVSSKTYNITNSSYYKYYKMVVTDGTGKAYICNLTITATEQVTVMTESTASDYDIYKDIIEYSAKKETVRKYYKYVSWTQPVLTSNGTVGGASFAANASSEYNSGSRAYFAFDSGSTQYWHSNSGHPQWLGWYNPNPLKITSIKVKNRNSDGAFINDYTVLCSNNGSNFIEVASGTSPNQTAYGEWTINISEADSYKYWRLNCTSSSGNNSSYTAVQQITITATELVAGTASNYDYYEDANIYKALEQ